VKETSQPFFNLSQSSEWSDETKKHLLIMCETEGYKETVIASTLKAGEAISAVCQTINEDEES
jgi:hypothetical protein